MTMKPLNCIPSTQDKRLQNSKIFLVITAVLLFFVSCDDGIEKSYWENGKLKSELHYENEKLEGECKWYHSNGQLWRQLTYCDGLKEGHSLRWHENGQLAEDSWYKDDELDSICFTYSEKGILVGEAHYKAGVLDGPFKTWYENGQLFQDGQYAEGMMDGEWFIFYPDGNLASKAVYDRGKGKQTGYDEMGCKIMEVTYLWYLEKARCCKRSSPFLLNTKTEKALWRCGPIWADCFSIRPMGWSCSSTRMTCSIIR